MNIFHSLRKASLPRSMLRAVAAITLAGAANLSTGYAQVGPAFRIANKPEVINSRSGSIPTQHTFGRNTSGDVIHYYWSPAAGWNAENLTTGYSNIGTAFRVVNILSVINGPTSDSNAPVQHVFGRNSVGDLIHYYWIKSQVEGGCQ